MTRRQKRKLIRILTGVLCTLCLGMVIGTVYAGNLNWNASKSQEAEEDVSKEEEVPAVKEVEEEPEEEELKEELPDDWNLILVNRTHPLPDDFEVELKSIGGGHKIDARAYEDYAAMMEAARKEGVYIYVTSSYRTMDKQIALHEAKIEEGVMMDYSYAEAKERAAEVVAVPGTSEHQAGLALDLVSSEYRKLNEKQEKTKGFQWLKENCYDYGFILRYPNGKTDVTGIIYEPWHFRYVGKKAAREMRASGQTLEEYLGAIPISEGIPVEYDSSMAETKKKSGKPSAPVQEAVPENAGTPEVSGESGTVSDPQMPSAPETPVEPAVPVVPETPPADTTPVEPSPPPAEPVVPVEPNPAPTEPAVPEGPPQEQVPEVPADPPPQENVPEQT